MPNDKPIETKQNVLQQIKELRDELKALKEGRDTPDLDPEMTRLLAEVAELRRMVETYKGAIDQHFRGN